MAPPCPRVIFTLGTPQRSGSYYCSRRDCLCGAGGKEQALLSSPSAIAQPVRPIQVGDIFHWILSSVFNHKGKGRLSIGYISAFLSEKILILLI